MTELRTVTDLEARRSELIDARKNIQTTLILCGGTGCRASRSLAVIEAVKRELAAENLEKKVHVRVTGCHGFCEQGPLVIVEPGNIFYGGVSPEDAHEIITRTVREGEVVERLLYTDLVSGQVIQIESEIPFYRSQNRRLLTQNRNVDPRSIEDYIAIGGYAALAKTLAEITPEAVVQEIMDSELRGRGGGGFPTGRKWAECREAISEEKYVICNADEGDPGAYMDRCLLEGNPHLVLEGMMIGAWAVGAQQGYVYVRNEYPLAVEHARVAVRQAREYGLLGQNILGSRFSFDIEIARGGGAFVCGESTALMASLEGKVGEPRPKDIHTVVDGLWHRPTTLNNVETWANIPAIIQNGSAWFAAQGSNHSKGTKILALTGRIKNTGLVEVALGTSLDTVIYDIGGGGLAGKRIKAVQTGGPSGGCLPTSKFDLPIDFDALAEAGSMIGSGGVVVMDEETCMVDVARYFLTFLEDESCGKCVPCRLGIDRMLEIITEIAEGRGNPGQIARLEELAYTMGETSLCGLGKTAANPVLSTLRYFREEYDAHINQKQCPAGVCRALIAYEVDPEKCNGCGLCKLICQHEAISGDKKEAHAVDFELCQKCGICKSECQFDAIQVISRGVK
jgi:NADH-quinone oxidoreductase subunit F